MIVLVTGAKIALIEPDDFAWFSVRIEGSGVPEGVRVDGAHAWVPIGRLNALAPAGDPGWPGKFDRMIDFARSKGWVDEADGTVRGHIGWD